MAKNKKKKPAPKKTPLWQKPAFWVIIIAVVVIATVLICRAG